MHNRVLTRQEIQDRLAIEQEFLQMEEEARQAALRNAEEKGRQEEASRIYREMGDKLDRMGSHPSRSEVLEKLKDICGSHK